MEPITVDFQRGVMRATDDLGWWGDPQELVVEITACEGGFPVQTFKDDKRMIKAVGDSTVLIFGEGDDRTLAMTAKSSMAPKFILTLEPMFRVASMSSPLPCNAENAPREAKKIAKQLQDEKASLETAKSREAQATSRTQKENLRARITELEAKIADYEKSMEQLKKLDVIARALHGKGKIHFRVFYKVGEHEIDFVRTQPVGSGG
jgi:hypothetical protein